MGAENILRHNLNRRWLLTFVFGLAHGFGFASVLRDIGVGEAGSQVAVPLFSFNLGVELGQIAIAAIVLPLLWKMKSLGVLTTRSVQICSYGVAAAGTYWFFERLLTA